MLPGCSVVLHSSRCCMSASPSALLRAACILAGATALAAIVPVLTFDWGCWLPTEGMLPLPRSCALSDWLQPAVCRSGRLCLAMSSARCSLIALRTEM